MVASYSFSVTATARSKLSLLGDRAQHELWLPNTTELTHVTVTALAATVPHVLCHRSGSDHSQLFDEESRIWSSICFLIPLSKVGPFIKQLNFEAIPSPWPPPQTWSRGDVAFQAAAGASPCGWAVPSLAQLLLPFLKQNQAFPSFPGCTFSVTCSVKAAQSRWQRGKATVPWEKESPPQAQPVWRAPLLLRKDTCASACNYPSCGFIWNSPKDYTQVSEFVYGNEGPVP